MIIDNNKYLLFNIQSDAVAANLQIFENLSRSKSEILRTSTNELIPPSTVPNGDIVAMIYTVPGYCQNSVKESNQNTTSYAIIHQCDNGDGYVIPKPADALMTGVIYDSIVDYKADWYQDEIV